MDPIMLLIQSVVRGSIMQAAATLVATGMSEEDAIASAMALSDRADDAVQARAEQARAEIEGKCLFEGCDQPNGTSHDHLCNYHFAVMKQQQEQQAPPQGPSIHIPGS